MNASNRPLGVSSNVPQEAIDEMMRDDPTQSNHHNNFDNDYSPEVIKPRSNFAPIEEQPIEHSMDKKEEE